MARMPKDEQDEHSPVAETFQFATLPQISVTGTPMVVAGVNRKINIGNYEGIDVYCGVTFPVDKIKDQDYMSELIADTKTAIAEAFSVVSTETFERYQLVKEAQEAYLKQKTDASVDTQSPN